MSPEIVYELVRRIERKDLSTAAHTWRVVLYTRALLEHFGITNDELRIATHAAALHDVGKLDIPDRILQKPGSLTDEEFEIIKLHTVSGYARMIHMDVSEEPILDLIRYHHERWDGKGYPYGISGDSIPIAPRMFAVIDSFDAMTSVRPYRSELGERAADNALVEIQSGSGTRYWPQAVDAFADLYRTGSLDFILHYFNDEVHVPEFQIARDEEFEHIRKDFGDRSVSSFPS